MINIGPGAVKNLILSRNYCRANQFLKQLAQIVLTIY
jgi:hypothetical protein